MSQANLQSLPLVFSFKQVIVGSGFFAGVRMNGRALLETETVGDHKEAWITGIAPVGITGGGGDRSVAFVEFRNAWVEVLFDIAATALSFEEFRDSCETFLTAEQASTTELWTDAVSAVRRNHYVDPSLRKENADTHAVGFEVVDLTHEQRGTDENQVETGLQVAA